MLYLRCLLIPNFIELLQAIMKLRSTPIPSAQLAAACVVHMKLLYNPVGSHDSISLLPQWGYTERDPGQGPFEIRVRSSCARALRRAPITLSFVSKQVPAKEQEFVAKGFGDLMGPY